MGEIKSAIELAMERTRGLVLDEKEKEALALKELENGLKALVLRLREEIIDIDEFRGEYGAFKGEKLQKSRALFDIVIDELDVTDDNAVKAMVEKVVAGWGTIDILVNMVSRVIPLTVRLKPDFSDLPCLLQRKLPLKVLLLMPSFLASSLLT